MFAVLIRQTDQFQAHSQDASTGTVHTFTNEVLLEWPVPSLIIQQSNVLRISVLSGISLSLTRYAENAPGLLCELNRSGEA